MDKSKLKFISTKGMPRDEWLKYQTKSIGGSTTGLVMGVSEYGSIAKRFHQYVGSMEYEEFMNPAMFMGHYLEDTVADLWQYYAGDMDTVVENANAGKKMRRMRKINYIVYNKDYPWLHANIDRLINKNQPAPWFEAEATEQEGILECKTINKFVLDKWEAGIPPAYLIQINHYMLVTGLRYAEMALLVDGRNMVVHRFEFNPEIGDAIVRNTKRFWDSIQECKKEIAKAKTEEEKIEVLDNYEPEPEGTDAYMEFLSDRYKDRENELELDGPDELFDDAAKYLELKKVKADSDKEMKTIKAKIKKYMLKHNCAKLTFPDMLTATNRSKFTIREIAH